MTNDAEQVVGLNCICGAGWEINNGEWELVHITPERVDRETYNRVFDDREKQTALLRQALEALEPCLTWEDGTTDVDVLAAITNIKQHLGQ